MGYLVEVTGRVRLPQDLEAEVVAALRDELVTVDGWLTPEEEIASLADLAEWVGAATVRDGDWVQFRPPDDSGDPKWSDQATAFYLGLGRWVKDGQIDVEGEDDERWGYRYGPDGVEQLGRSGYDGAGSSEDALETDQDAAPAADSRETSPRGFSRFLRRRP